MSWLKAFGRGALKALQVADTTVTLAAGFPAALAQVKTVPGIAEKMPAVASVFDEMQQAVMFSELIGLTHATSHDAQTLSRAERLDLAVKQVAVIVTRAEDVAGYECGDRVLRDKAIYEFAQATCDLLNSRKPPVE